MPSAYSNVVQAVVEPPAGFSFEAGAFTLSHTFSGFQSVGYNGNPSGNGISGGGPGCGALLSGNVLGLAVDCFSADNSPGNAICIGLRGATGSEVFTLTFTDNNGTQWVLPSSSGQAVSYNSPGAGVSWRWFVGFQGIFFTQGATYVVAVS